MRAYRSWRFILPRKEVQNRVLKKVQIIECSRFLTPENMFELTIVHGSFKGFFFSTKQLQKQLKKKMFLQILFIFKKISLFMYGMNLHFTYKFSTFTIIKHKIFLIILTILTE